MDITVVGQGYVGLVTAACLADWGHRVTGIDADPHRVSSLRAGIIPFHEPGLADLVDSGVRGGRLSFATRSSDLIAQSDVVFLAVGTHDGNGGWQTATVLSCFQEILPDVRDDAVVVIRSTLPPEFVGQLSDVVGGIRRRSGRRPVAVMLNPEFTREGAAIHDFQNPDRVVVGTAHDPDGRGADLVASLYASTEAPVLVMPAIDAALTKLGSNLFLATKISFVNEYAGICDAFGASIDNVVDAMGYDARIGGRFLRAGVGFGGSCLPHQVTMTVRTAAGAGIAAPLLSAVDEINHRRRTELVDRLALMLGRPLGRSRVAMLGLTFKPSTDDLRDAPSLTVARILAEQGAQVIAWDPMPAARERAAELVPSLETTADIATAVSGADAAAVITEWPDLRSVDWTEVKSLMRGDVVFDGRNALDPSVVVAAGFRYGGFGRGTMGHPTVAVDRDTTVSSPSRSIRRAADRVAVGE